MDAGWEAGTPQSHLGSNFKGRRRPCHTEAIEQTMTRQWPDPDTCWQGSQSADRHKPGVSGLASQLVPALRITSLVSSLAGVRPPQSHCRPWPHAPTTPCVHRNPGLVSLRETSTCNVCTPSNLQTDTLPTSCQPCLAATRSRPKLPGTRSCPKAVQGLRSQSTSRLPGTQLTPLHLNSLFLLGKKRLRNEI